MGVGAKLENWLFRVARGEKVFNSWRTGSVLNLEAGTLNDLKSKKGVCGLELAGARQERIVTV